MNKDELRRSLRVLIEEYIDDKDYALELIATLADPKAKFILAEIDRRKTKDYSPELRNMMKDIAFYYL